MKPFEAIQENFNFCKSIYGLGDEPRRICRFFKRFHQTIIASSAVLVVFEFFYCGFFIEDDIFDRFMLVTVGFAAICGSTVGIQFFRDIENYQECLDWCHAWHFYQHNNFSWLFLVEFRRCVEKCRSIFRFFIIWLPTIFFSLYGLQPLVLSLWNQKFTLAFPMSIPYLPPDTTIRFLLNLSVHLVFGMTVSFGMAALFGTTATTVEHMKTLISVMIRIIRGIQDEKDSKEIQKTLKLIVDLHCEFIDRQKKLTALTSTMLLLFESGSSAMLVVSWIIVFIVHRNFWVTMSALAVIGIFISVCFFNESLTSSYLTLNEAIYGTEWCSMKKKDQQMICYIICATHRMHLLKTGPLSVANLEHLFNWSRKIYSYCLFIENLMKDWIVEIVN